MAFQQRPLSQFAPPRIAERPAFDLFLAPDRVLLATAIDRCGQRDYPSTWTGNELLSRQKIETPVGPQRHEFSAEYPPVGSGGKTLPARTVWLVETRFGMSSYASPERADEMWQNEKDKVQRLYEDEVAARTRFSAMVLKIRGKLATAEWKSFVLNRKSGQEYEIPSTFWRSDAAAFAFELEDDIAKWRNPNATTVALPVGTYGQTWELRGNIVLPLDQIPAERPQKEYRVTSHLSEDEARFLFLAEEGPIRSPIDSALYYTWEAYRDHLRDHGAGVIRPVAPALSTNAQPGKTTDDIPGTRAEVDDGGDRKRKSDTGKTGLSFAGAESRCRAWLVEEMRKSPSPRKAKAEYLAEGKGMFLGLSRRGFDRAWAWAVSATGATEWTAPGRRADSN
jgi:hypothetical protein